MPIYQYEVLNEEGKVVEIFEAEQVLGAEPLTKHPVTGEAMRRLFTPPGINAIYSNWKDKLEPGKLAGAGFTRYEKDKATGRYFKSNQGQGPAEIDPHAG
jgi:hypothetical protein